MNTNALTATSSLDHTPHHVHVAFSRPHHVISSAVLNGGMVHASHILNLKVPKHSKPSESPEATLTDYCAASGWQGTAVCMMTAASMDSLRITRESKQDVDVIVLVTSGLSNPRRVGDRAEYREMTAETEEVGTINTIAMTSAILTQSAMVEALMIATEAKSAALQELGIRSSVSNHIATGTGTDATAVVAGHGPGKIRYCGKHVLFGEVLGRLVMDAVSSSIAWDLTHRT
ncbi:MAG: adenosylcobinamide amidohydrolase [Deltaproteobacteria bacterium]|nr:adenosylcobinamide amidohydrolase [Deltaproteobacteria bacterium]